MKPFCLFACFFVKVYGLFVYMKQKKKKKSKLINDILKNKIYLVKIITEDTFSI